MASELYVETLKGLTSGDNANKVIIPSGQTLEIDAWSPPAGTVLQVVSANTTTEVSTTSNSYSDTGLTASITPVSTSSKIWVSASVCVDINESDLCDLKLLRDSTDVLETGYNGYHSGSTNYLIAHCKLELLDSPSTTDQVTYKVQFKRGQGDNALYVNYDDGTGDTRSFITLMEIAG